MRLMTHDFVSPQGECLSRVYKIYFVSLGSCLSCRGSPASVVNVSGLDCGQEEEEEEEEEGGGGGEGGRRRK